MGLGRNVLFRVATSKRLERAVKRVPGGELAAWRSASRYVASRSRSGARLPVASLGCCNFAAAIREPLSELRWLLRRRVSGAAAIRALRRVGDR